MTIRSTAGSAPIPHFLASTGSVLIYDVRCRGGTHAAEEFAWEDQIVLVRRGLFEWRDTAGRTLADPGMALVVPAGTTYRVTHPLDGGDRCTAISLEGEARRELIAEVGATPGHAAARALPPSAHLLHRSLLALCSGAPEAASTDSLAIEERALTLAWMAVRGVPETRAPRRPRTRPVPRAGTEEAHRDLATRARIEMARDLASPLSLADLSRRVGSSPYHLCRVFREREGLPLHRYRTRLRLLYGLERMLEGERLLDIALDCGFSSHAHFTSLFTREFGTAPSRAIASAARQTRTILEAARPFGR